MFKENDLVVKKGFRTVKGTTPVGKIVGIRKRSGHPIEYRYTVLWENYPDEPFYNYTENELESAPASKARDSVVQGLIDWENELVEELKKVQKELDRVRTAKEVIIGLS